MYRLKFELEDGRKVYASKRGEIEVMTGERIKHIRPETIAQMAYSLDLSVFGPIDVLNKHNIPLVKIKRAVIEPTSKPLDRSVTLQSRESGNL